MRLGQPIEGVTCDGRNAWFAEAWAAGAGWAMWADAAVRGV